MAFRVPVEEELLKVVLDFPGRLPVRFLAPAVGVFDFPRKQLVFGDGIHLMEPHQNRGIHGQDEVEPEEVDLGNVPRAMLGYVGIKERSDKLDGFFRRGVSVGRDPGAFDIDGFAQPLFDDDLGHGAPAYIGEADNEDLERIVWGVFHGVTSEGFITGEMRVVKTDVSCDNRRMKIMGICCVLVLLAARSGASGQSQALETVPNVDLQRYMGKWYEIASFPQRFEKGCTCTMAEYELTDKGYVRVINSCRKDSPAGKLTVAKGKAFIVEGSNNARLKVQFFWPFRGDYWIIDLAQDYSYAVVGAPDRKYLWILCRATKMDEGLYQDILKRIAQKGFDVSKLQRTEQGCPDR